MPGRTQFVGSGATASSRSAPVTTVTTPGIFTARSTETDRIRACARAAQQGDVQSAGRIGRSDVVGETSRPRR